ncbi:MAG TPA: hypothetical protein PKE19_11170 [Aestuariivirga sp.]|jgi:hypothetical protein|nr:hypothetical protein [Aestuariivirga sp.]
MVKLVNALLVFAVLVSAAFLYGLEHRTRGAEKIIAGLKRDIAEEGEAMKLLKAEWASLIRPDRLQKLAEANGKLKPAMVDQYVSLNELMNRLPDAPVKPPEARSDDPIGAILKEMEEQ